MVPVKFDSQKTVKTLADQGVTKQNRPTQLSAFSGGGTCEFGTDHPQYIATFSDGTKRLLSWSEVRKLKRWENLEAGYLKHKPCDGEIFSGFG